MTRFSGLTHRRMAKGTLRRLLLAISFCVASETRADAIQPLPRPMKGVQERGAEPVIESPPSAPMDMRLQQGRVWKQAKVNNARIGMAYLDQHKSLPGVKTLKSGVQYKIIMTGEGQKPKKDDTVEVYYSGTLADGAVFVNARTPGQPATLKVSEAVPGLKQALRRMPLGAKWQIVVPPQAGYGDNGAPPTVGPGAVLIYEVELVGIKPGQVKEGAAEITPAANESVNPATP